MTYENFSQRDQTADGNRHDNNLNRQAWDQADGFNWKTHATPDTGSQHVPNLSFYDGSAGTDTNSFLTPGTGSTEASTGSQGLVSPAADAGNALLNTGADFASGLLAPSRTTTEAQPGGFQPMSEQQQLAAITQDIAGLTALEQEIAGIESQLGIANQAGATPPETASPLPAPPESTQPTPLPTDSTQPTPAPPELTPPAPASSTTPTPAPSELAPPTQAPPTSIQPTPMPAAGGDPSQSLPETGSPSTSIGDVPPVPGGITLPTPAAASDVALALAAGAGSNNNPHIISVSNNTELQNAVNSAQAGDTIELASGTYQPITINNSGEAGAPITVEAAPGQTPVIDASNTDAGVSIQGNYIAVQGLTITDLNYGSITLAAAQAADGDSGNATMSSDGIAVGNNQNNPNHITIQNNKIYNTTGGGIETMGADDLAVVGNNIQNAAAYSPWGESGISIFQSQDSDGQSGSTGVYVLNNQVSGTQQLVNSEAIGQNVITDGNGIILDTNSSTYDKQILVAGNNVTGNDRGIEVGNTNNATVEGNTAYNNDNSTDTFGLDNIALINSSGDTVMNNVTNDGTSITNAATGFQTYNASYSA